MNFGGPVWHASTAHGEKNLLRRMALAALDGVGDATLGQWEDWTGRAYHVRRRLNAAESALVGPVVDVRGTPEEFRRLDAVKAMLPRGWKE